MSILRGDDAPLAMPSGREVDRAIRFTYAQTMLKSLFWASTTGMFLVGFAMKLGAGDTLLGLMSSVPAVFIVTQIFGGALAERGYSRKRLAIGFGLVVPIAWFLIAAIPLLSTDWARAHLGPLGGASARVQLAILITLLAASNAALQISYSVRASWVGELVPPSRMGRFYGYVSMCSGIVAVIAAVCAGRVLDFVKSHGLMAFGGLFVFGALSVLGWALLFIPQPDCPLPREEKHPGVREIGKRVLKNKPFVRLAFANALVMLGSISNPFVAAYMLRDVGVSYFQLGLLTAVTTIASLASAPAWGRLSERFGCRPVMTLGWLGYSASFLVWFAIPPGGADRAVVLLPFTNLLAGMALAAANVSHSTIVYRISQPVGRSVQLALYFSFVILIGAPMPFLGGFLVTAMKNHGILVDLRVTFFATAVFYCLAAAAATRIGEPGAAKARFVAFHYLPQRVARVFGVNLAGIPAYAALIKRIGGEPDAR